ncbi:class I SAM-dependent methyltransferase [Octadecabacter sp. R77987]|uniref:class I SAM-dependent methyltransferase n=1 Tax=Octadecabacter sp. R77987 TaxID=3093874 RepID=UPI00366AFFD8
MTTASFWDKRARKYAASKIADQAAYEYTRERTRSYLASTDTVLEMGCGTGSTALELAPNVRQIIGTDVSSEMVKIATEKAHDQGVANASFRVAPVDAALDGPEPVNVVTGFNIFHLVRNREGIFGDIHRKLPTGGLFISKTPCLSEPSIGIKRFAFAAMIPPMRLLGIAPYVSRFSFAQLEGAIRDAGFDLIEVGSFPAMSRYIVARKR